MPPQGRAQRSAAGQETPLSQITGIGPLYLFHGSALSFNQQAGKSQDQLLVDGLASMAESQTKTNAKRAGNA